MYSVVYVSASHLHTANLQENQKVRIYNLSAEKSSHGLPSLKSARIADTILVSEVLGSSSQSHDRQQRHDWLTLLIRESLGRECII